MIVKACRDLLACWNISNCCLLVYLPYITSHLGFSELRDENVIFLGPYPVFAKIFQGVQIVKCLGNRAGNPFIAGCSANIVGRQQGRAAMYNP